MTTYKTLRLILGDQLNSQHSWYRKSDDSITYLLMEIRSETDYAKHHIQKILGFFAAMRQFAKDLEEKKHRVIYLKLNDEGNLHSFEKNISLLIQKEKFSSFEYQLPDEYRVNKHLVDFCKTLGIENKAVDSEHFVTKRTDLAEFFKGKKNYLLESFYRSLRKKHNLLMDGEQPLAGQWNFDKDNRKKLPANHKCTPPFLFENNVVDIFEMLSKTDVQTIGTVDPTRFIWPVSRQQSIQLLEFFVRECLPLFGTYEDAMTPHDWSLYHSRLSFSLNTKLLSPLEVIDRAVAEWKHRPHAIGINQLEGFVRQILGWREYMRGIYWWKMPAFSEMNFLDNQQKLPVWYWTGETKLNCLSHSIRQSLNYAYAHHIQRLMITGNFALLAGVQPNEVDAWYLGIYIDAIEWVEITNTRGMSQFADGGIIGSKPYVSSAAYIDKMSHYCSSCYYKKDLKTGDKACPFNSLYWNFYSRNEKILSKNPRVGMMYNIWQKMKPSAKTALLEQAEYYINNLDTL